MPNRILKESICRSDQINSLSPFEEVLFYRLIVNADDYGRFDGRIAIIKSLLFPLKDSIRADQIEKAIKTLSSVELVDCYTVAGKPFIRLTGWDRHQSIRAKKSKYPSPDEAEKHDEATCEHLKSSEIKCMQMKANVPVIQSESESESESNPKGERARATARFTPPTPDEVRAYAAEKCLTVDADRFCDFYASKGWRVGSQPMRDWKAAVRGWCARDRQDADHPNARCQTVKTVREQQYTQRAYTEDDSLPDWMMERLAEGQAKKGASP